MPRSRSPKTLSLKDVAQAAGVHSSTVSRALNPETAKLLTPQVVERVQRAASELGYSINTLAAGLRTSYSRTIGVVVRDLTNTMLPVMFRGIEDRLRLDGYTALVGNTYASPERKRELIDTFLSRRVDGFILTYAEVQDTAVAAIRRRSLPLVLLNRETGSKDDVCILPDVEGGMQQALSYLFSLGHRSVGHIAGPEDSIFARDKENAFLALAQACGFNPKRCPIIRPGQVSEDAGRDAAHQLLRAKSVTAIVAANDILALGCLAALKEAGVQCPRDVSVVGFNDMPYVDRVMPGLTTVHIPHYDMGYEAASLLMDQIKGKSVTPKKRLLPATLIARGSTARRKTAS